MRAVGGTINITCKADGIPEPRVVWRRNGRVVLTENSDTRQRWVVTIKSGRPGFRTQVPTQMFVSSQLVIKQILETDNNTRLTCSAINSFGQSVTITYTLVIAPSKSRLGLSVNNFLQFSIHACLAHVVTMGSVIQILKRLSFVCVHKVTLVKPVKNVSCLYKI